MKNYLFFLVFFVNLLHFGFGTDWGDSDNRDETGCPKIFKKKCTCKEQNYLRYQPTRNDTSVVNCTNSGYVLLYFDLSMSKLHNRPENLERLLFHKVFG